jgi:membrane protease YdiL (CAAX protease family)
MDFEALGIDKNVGFILLILMFVGALLALWVVIKYLHQKRMVDLVTAQKPIQYHKIFFGFGLWMILTLLLEGVNYLVDPSNYTFRWAGSNYIVLLLISFVFLPIQTSFEELFFRGYIMQGLVSISNYNWNFSFKFNIIITLLVKLAKYITKYKWFSILGSSIFFGLVHGTNPEVEEYGFWTMQSYYVVAGLFLALITVLDDGLELALGVHAATNIGGATLFTYKGSVLQTDSLFITEEVKPLLMLAGFILASILFITICYMKYQWPSWRTLNEPILSPDSSKDEIFAIGQEHDL